MKSERFAQPFSNAAMSEAEPLVLSEAERTNNSNKSSPRAAI